MRSWLPALLLPSLAAAQVNVAVDVTADVHPISPLIYGINFADDDQLTLGIPLSRWGGNTTTRYNWQQDVSDTGQDYFFENLPGCWGTAGNYCSPLPADPQTNSGANGFLALAAQHQIHTLFTVPVMGLVARPPKYAHPFDCGCPKTLVATQDSFDPYDTNCGNGYAGGARVTCNGAAISQAFGAAEAQAWASYLVTRFGASSGRRIYQLDNEPNLWGSTHYDAHPVPTTYDELWGKSRDTAVALLAADPTAEISGPAEWGWSNYFCSAKDTATGGCSASSPDRAAHGGTELVAWLLQQAKAHQDGSGKRILHWLDLHYYPQGGNGPDNVRSLWDPTYVDPSWIASTGISGGIVRLIPRMRDWVSQNFPGTRISVSEYAWFNDVNGAKGPVIYAEVLGVFGRERLDAATAWGGPGKNDTAFVAFRLFRNYDGNGGAFGDSSVRATAAGSGVAAFAATGAGRLTVALINETTSATTVNVQPSGGAFGSTAQWWRTSSNATLTRQSDVAVGSGGASVSLPAQSIGMLVVPLTSGSGPDAGAPDGGGTQPDGGSSGSDGGVVPDAGSGGADGGSDGGVPPGGGGNPTDDPTAGVTGSCAAGGTQSSAELPLALLVVGVAFAVRARHRR